MKKPTSHLLLFPTDTDYRFPGEDNALGPAICENANKRIDGVTIISHFPTLSEISINVEVENFTVTNHETYGWVTLTYDLFSTEYETLEIVIYLGRVLVTDSTYLVTEARLNSSEFINTVLEAYGDLGEAVTPGYQKTVVMNVNYVIGNDPPYNEFILVQRINGIDRMIGYCNYELTEENLTEQSILNP